MAINGNNNTKRNIPLNNSKGRELPGWRSKFISILKELKTIIAIIGVGVAGFVWITETIDEKVADHTKTVDARVANHTKTVSTTLDTVSNTLTSQIGEIKNDVRHLDGATREADAELRGDIKKMNEHVIQMQGGLERLSADIESLVHKRGEEEKPHNAAIRISATR